MRNALLTLAAVALFPTVAFAGDLTVKIENVRNAQGSVLAALYDSEASYMKQPSARSTFKVKAIPGEVQYVLHDLPAGKYAISVFHDENSNGKLDTNLVGIPKEGYGFSNGSGRRPPTFEKAAFQFDGTAQSITITLQY
jgi:uncharacterized protein (DUF2141 family)